MIAVKVTTTSGVSWRTSIKGTIETARAYFVGQLFDVGEYPVERMERAVSVELTT